MLCPYDKNVHMRQRSGDVPRAFEESPVERAGGKLQSVAVGVCVVGKMQIEMQRESVVFGAGNEATSCPHTQPQHTLYRRWPTGRPLVADWCALIQIDALRKTKLVVVAPAFKANRLLAAALLFIVDKVRREQRFPVFCEKLVVGLW